MPAGVKKVLGGFQHSGADIRWTPPGNLHLTLRFIGEAGEEIRDRLIAPLGEIEIDRFNLCISGVGYFPPGKHPEIVWAGIEENTVLLNLQYRVETVCRAIGLKAEERSFMPHITIGRVKGASRGEVLSFVNRHKKLKIDGVPVDEFTLYESRLGSDEALHIPLQRFILRPHK